ncbi:MAG: TM2 domain-containing protein [Nitrospirae bacterium]|nr:TM2 domain-containing protein [Nitrospirota bacterium]
MYCRNCGNSVAETAQYCMKCGVPPLKDSKFCQSCGVEVNPQQEVCIKCGVHLLGGQHTFGFSAQGFSTRPKEKIVAGLLGIFLGWLGVHRFYLGYTGIGIAQIIITLVTAGAGGLWGLIEGILILTGNINKDAQGRPLIG